MRNRKEEYLLALQSASMNKKVKSLKAMESYGYLTTNLFGLGKTIDDIREVLDEVFPDNWDIIISKNYNNPTKKEGWVKDTPFTAEFVIHFPEILITNRDNESHIIRDFYIKLMPWCSATGMSFNRFRGKRMSATRREVVSHYQHSHQSGRHYIWDDSTDSQFHYRGFCLGSSEIIHVLSMLRSMFSKGRFKLFLLQLEEYLNYESIEGNPYKRISKTIGGGKPQKVSENACETYYNLLLKHREQGRHTKEVDFKLERNKIILVDNDKFEDFLKVHQKRALYGGSQICEKDEVGEYYGYRNIPRSFPRSVLIRPDEYKHIEFMFRGEVVSFKLIEEVIDGIDKPYYISKHIKNYVKTRIEQKIEGRRFKSYITEQLNSPAYSTANTRQDSIPVPENQ